MENEEDGLSLGGEVDDLMDVYQEGVKADAVYSMIFFVFVLFQIMCLAWKLDGNFPYSWHYVFSPTYLLTIIGLSEYAYIYVKS